MSSLNKADPDIAEAIKNELERQRNGLQMIPSENVASPAVLEALGSVFTNKYSEGYPGKRYYGGNQFVDVVEKIAIERAKKLFGVPYANVQPYSGSPANFAVYMATCNLGDVVMGQNLPDGGHITHGWKVNFSSQLFKSVPYHVRADGYIDMDEVWELARKNKPKLIWCGATAYPREFPFEEFSKVADEVGAYFVADISHISGLIVAGAHKSPTPFAHILTTTTHKTLRGPRGAIIMVTQKGLDKDPELGDKIDRAIFPGGAQGGPHDHQTAAIAVALGEALKPEFKEYGKQIVKNCNALATRLKEKGLKLVSGGTDNHMAVIDLTPYGIGKGIFAEKALDLAKITVNKNTIPKEPSSPFYPSGIRVGTPILTSRGMKEKEMQIIAEWIAEIINEIKDYQLPEENKTQYIKKFVEDMKKNSKISETKKKVENLCKQFPLYPDL